MILGYKRCLRDLDILKISFFINSQENYEVPKRAIRPNRNIYHLFKLKNFRDVKNFYQDKASMDKTLDHFRFQTSTSLNEKYKHLTFDKTKDK